jgi:hypothetical protein
MLDGNYLWITMTLSTDNTCLLTGSGDMAHYLEIEDSKGDLVDVLVFCTDFCHEAYARQNGLEYKGWNGCHELDFDQNCLYCEDTVHGLSEKWEG